MKKSLMAAEVGRRKIVRETTLTDEGKRLCDILVRKGVLHYIAGDPGIYVNVDTVNEVFDNFRGM